MCHGRESGRKDMAEWYYLLSDGQQQGPVTGTQLKSLAATGSIGPDDLVWNESMKEWAKAGRACAG